MPYTKIAIIGSRDFDNIELFDFSISRIFETYEISNPEIVSGGAKGADSFAKALAVKNNLPYKEFLPDWKAYGKSAGPKRNKQIVEYSDLIIAFWDGKSKGTLSSIQFAKELTKKLVVICYKEIPNEY